MAPMRNAVRAALLATASPDFDRYVQRARRAPDALVRHAVALLGSESPDTLRLVTISFSATVLRVLESLARRQPIHVSCSDGQPGLEGRRLAERLAAAGIAVTHYTDAALGHAIAGATAVLVGADAVTPDWFLNKTGTRMLAAVAGSAGGTGVRRRHSGQVRLPRCRRPPGHPRGITRRNLAGTAGRGSGAQSLLRSHLAPPRLGGHFRGRRSGERDGRGCLPDRRGRAAAHALTSRGPHPGPNP